MSVRVMSWVFQHSAAKGTDRLVLLAIADSANDHGCESWPSLTTLASKAGVDRRTVTRSLARLIDMGELEKVRQGGLTTRGGVSNSYRVVCPHPQAQGRDAPRGEMPLGAGCPEVGAESPKGRGEVPPYPSLSILNHPRSTADGCAQPDFAANAATARALKEQHRAGTLRDEPRSEATS